MSKKSKRPPAPTSPERMRSRKLSQAELSEKEKSYRLKHRTIRDLERRKAAKARDINAEIKSIVLEMDHLNDEIEQGYELLPQGSLNFDEVEEGAPKIPQAKAKGTLAALAVKTGEVAPPKPKPVETKEAAERIKDAKKAGNGNGSGKPPVGPDAAAERLKNKGASNLAAVPTPEKTH